MFETLPPATLSNLLCYHRKHFFFFLRLRASARACVNDNGNS